MCLLVMLLGWRETKTEKYRNQLLTLALLETYQALKDWCSTIKTHRLEINFQNIHGIFFQNIHVRWCIALKLLIIGKSFADKNVWWNVVGVLQNSKLIKSCRWYSNRSNRNCEMSSHIMSSMEICSNLKSFDHFYLFWSSYEC